MSDSVKEEIRDAIWNDEVLEEISRSGPYYRVVYEEKAKMTDALTQKYLMENGYTISNVNFEKNQITVRPLEIEEEEVTKTVYKADIGDLE